MLHFFNLKQIEQNIDSCQFGMSGIRYSIILCAFYNFRFFKLKKNGKEIEKDLEEYLKVIFTCSRELLIYLSFLKTSIKKGARLLMTL